MRLMSTSIYPPMRNEPLHVEVVWQDRHGGHRWSWSFGLDNESLCVAAKTALPATIWKRAERTLRRWEAKHSEVDQHEHVLW